MNYVICARWYEPCGLTRIAEYRPRSFALALATITRWRAADINVGGGLSDYWMRPA